ncbi:MAG: cell wall-binding repeat-containing protein, partial [Actinomycetota bacterium]|nr:cell wall-binding repeat-containing protein [Actinomycetota bacterium]
SNRQPALGKRNRLTTGASLAAYVAALKASGAVTVVAMASPAPGTRMRRIGGADRYATSALISANTFDSASAVIVTTGLGFADALSSSGLAGCLNAPILLTRPGGLPLSVADEIRRLGATDAYIAGGTIAVSSNVESQLEGVGLDVTRLGGNTRYDTAAVIAKKVLGFGQNNGRVFIARGDDFPDALSLGPLACSARAPILLVKPSSMPPATSSMLSAGGFTTACIGGGTLAVGKTVEATTRSYVAQVDRAAGHSRYDTAVAAASYATATGLSSYEYVGIATGLNYADALCGGAAAGSRNGVVLLALSDFLHAATANAISANTHAIRYLDVYGGTNAIAGVVTTSISQMLR